MSKLVRKVIGWVLVLTLVAAQILIPMPMQANATEAWDYAGNSSAANDIQAGVTLHCWNWSFENIEKNMALIASQGYTAIQTNPIQLTKQATAGYPVNDWWVYYQPAAFAIDDSGNSALGNKAQFESMCEAAHKYGIYVIVDVVANHMADAGSNNISSAVIADIRNDSSCWHDYSRNISNYYDRYNITQYCLDGVPDLNTSSSKVQGYVLNYLKELIDSGADGFRFDAVKHIETPEDTYCASNFWPTVVDGAKSYASSSRGLDLYCYGELLYHADEGESLPDSAYTKYMNVTDNSWSNTVRNNVVGAGNAGAFSYGFHKNAEPNQLVLWAESHDNYAGDGTRGISVQNINKTWALVTARANAMSLYLARPENTYPQLLGVASMTGWSYPEVAAVNHFHNYFHGQGEYVSNMNNIAYVERGNSGVVLVNCGGTSTSVSVTAYAMANGTYTDQITGNTFTVSNGKITGQIGSTGIAVVYNASQCDHPSHDTSGNCTSCYKFVDHNYSNGYCSVCGKEEPGTRVIYFDNSSKNWSNVYAYVWDDYNNQYTGEWPGTKMTKVSGETNIYSIEVSEEAYRVIFNDGGSNQTSDQALNTSNDLFDGTTWSVYTPSEGGSTDSGSTDSGNTDSGSTDSGSTDSGSTDTSTTRTIYYDNSASKWSNVYIYTWNDSGNCTGTWPGTKMTLVSGESYIYSCEVPNDAVNVIFNNGSGTQTSDLTLQATKDLYSSNTWTTYTASSGDSSGSTDTSDTRTLYFNNNSTNWSNVYVYAWSGSSTQHTGSWPGTAMTLADGEYNVYTYEVPTDATYIIFNNGGSLQTADLTIPSTASGLDMYNSASSTWKTYSAASSDDPGSITLYCDASVVGWSTVYIYAWTGDTQYTGAWPGIQMPLADGESAIYSYELTTEATNVIFSNGNGIQTSNLLVPEYDSGYNMYCPDDGSWTGYTAASAAWGMRDYTTAADTATHYYEIQVIAPTCDEYGYTTHTCVDCYYSYDDSFVEALGHEYETDVIRPTETTDGYTIQTCTVCGDSYVAGHVSCEDVFVLAGTNVALGNTLNMNFFITKGDISGTDYYAEITHYAEDGTVTHTIPFDQWEERTDYWVVTLDGLAARQMADNVDIVIYHSNGVQASVLATDSIRSYAMRILEGQNAKTKALLVDMLNYGAAAQVYFGYNEDDLANNQLLASQQDYATDSVTMNDQRVKGDNYYGSTLTLKSRILLSIYFKGINTDMYATVSFTDHKGNVHETRVEGSEFTKYNTEVYGVVIDDLVVADGDKLVTVKVFDTNGNQVAYASDTMNSYATRMFEGDMLYEMVMKFTASAYAYFHT